MILNGKKVAGEILEDIKQKVSKLEKKPRLAVVLVGDDEASKVYVRNKKKAANFIGVDSTVIELDKTATQQEVIDCIEKLNKDDNITAILVQMPLPEHIDKNKVITAISPKKDIDCFTPENVGKLSIGMKPYFYPVTPQGILMLLDYYNVDLDGKHVCIIGRSNIVGKPLLQMILQRNATVTICHSHTKELEKIIKTADIVISAVGKKVVRCKMVKNKAVFIDVGISRNANDKLTGDLNWEVDFGDFNEVIEFFELISPVPGGVGPMTIASLMFNLLLSE